MKKQFDNTAISSTLGCHKTEGHYDSDPASALFHKSIEKKMASWNLGMFLLVVVLTSLSLRNSARAQTYTVLHNFSSATGTGPEFAVLAQGRDGNLYGTTTQGGLNNVGVVFRSTPTGAYTVRYNFDVTHGSTPFGGLTLGVDGNFYGTTEIGGTSNDGTVFKISPSGLLTTLFNFDYANDDGTALPYAAPIQGADGNFYGTTYYARAYKLMPTGQMDVIQTSGSSYAPMVQGVDGKFYGATSNGGNSLNGSIFSVNATNGLYSDIYSFAGNSSGNASGPYGGLVQDSDGNFYGTTPWGGSLGGGTIFQVSATGNFTELHEFSTDTSGNSCGSTAGLVYASDGNFYGVTGGCGTLGYGVDLPRFSHPCRSEDLNVAANSLGVR